MHFISSRTGFQFSQIQSFLWKRLLIHLKVSTFIPFCEKSLYSTLEIFTKNAKICIKNFTNFYFLRSESKIRKLNQQSQMRLLGVFLYLHFDMSILFKYLTWFSKMIGNHYLGKLNDVLMIVVRVRYCIMGIETSHVMKFQIVGLYLKKPMWHDKWTHSLL